MSVGEMGDLVLSLILIAAAAGFALVAVAGSRVAKIAAVAVLLI